MKNLIFLGVVSAFMLLASCQKDSTVTPDSGATSTVIPVQALGVLGDTLPLGTLPDSVRNYILTNYPGATITVVESETRHGVKTYEVEILVGGVRKELYFSATWVFLNLRNGNCGSGGAGGDNHGGGNHGNGGGGRDSIYNVVIPAATLAQIKASYPSDTVVIGKRELHNSVVTYQVVIKNGSTIRFITYDANWVFVSISAGDGNHHDHGNGGGGNGGNGGGHNEVDIAISTIPTAVTTYISTTYAGYTITKAEKETENGVVTYEVEITKGTTKKWLIFSATWVFLREEH